MSKSYKKATLIFPHQLFSKHPATSKDHLQIVVEQDLFFTQYKFHKQKLLFHRASMKFYEEMLDKRGYPVTYLAFDESESIKKLFEKFSVKEVHYSRLHDDYLSKWVKKYTKNLKTTEHESPYFFSDFDWIEDTLKNQKNYYLTSFYTAARKKADILVKDGKPKGGKWTYDKDNRKSLPKKYEEPPVFMPPTRKYIEEAKKYVDKNFSKNPGRIDNFFYPVTHRDARDSLENFIEFKLSSFGDYQDAFGPDLNFLEHSILSPLINSGLLVPSEVIESVLEKSKVPLNSLEGFIRQVVGWRDFFGGVYALSGKEQRTSNFFNHKKKLPKSFWTAETGLPPVDNAIERILETGYTHHIERLMVLGNIMVLCEYDPDEVYKWFMELFIDSYDWVMVPNVYGMSQYADGGLITTKPYISSSNYIRKMSSYKKGEWCDIWDGLYWSFISKHKKFFASNPRLSIMAKQLEKMDSEKLKKHKRNAKKFLES